MKCQYCGREIPPRVNNCPACGGACEYITPADGNPSDAQANSFLQKTDVKPVDFGIKPEGEQKSRPIYILLGIFLGELGIHNFYAGYNSKGIKQLILSLLFSWTVFIPFIVYIWAIIDVCTVTKDASGRPFETQTQF